MRVTSAKYDESLKSSHKTLITHAVNATAGGLLVPPEQVHSSLRFSCKDGHGPFVLLSAYPMMPLLFA
jgi:hypothetical protein